MKQFLFAALVACAALSPFMYQGKKSTAPLNFPGWPQELNGNALTELPLSDRERYFSADFPGKIGRFTDGQREIVVRWVASASRKLHPSADCFRGAGYSVSPLPLLRDLSGAHWSCFSAERGHKNSRVCERIYDDMGGAWSDTSTWFWDAVRGKSAGPWWAVTVAES